MNDSDEILISVDVEAAGPVPGEYSLLSIGACSVFHPQDTFACKLKPINGNFDPKALEVSCLSLSDLERTGVQPVDAMQSFANWIGELTNSKQNPVFVGFNAPFDWSFVNYYFHRFMGSNPFGFTAIDIKAFYMGATGCKWKDTRSSKIAESVKPILEGTHDALQDALYQAEIFRLILANQHRNDE
ncbi:3'-5' exonuclease [Roseibium marinum]|uniref:DNA polymerase III epsilon subunit-like protein n=1 Tax=Roseibium marinum TaxID=281252 RepID=A0A2S3URA5_9HYPH|nr:3'-5' exonuclease [Roseibium marinum]POF30247.1 DNA polymerase III epsilon subunit-like protein [Roseibium marinum]